MFLLRVKLITQGEKRETSTKTCNETMLRDKLKVFVSRISPPLAGFHAGPLLWSNWNLESWFFVKGGKPVNQETEILGACKARTRTNSAHNSFSSPEAALLLVSTKKSRPLAWSNNGSPRFTDFPSLCACSESSLTNLIGSGFNILCSQSHSKTECRWTRPEVVISWC